MTLKLVTVAYEVTNRVTKKTKTFPLGKGTRRGARGRAHRWADHEDAAYGAVCCSFPRAVVTTEGQYENDK